MGSAIWLQLFVCEMRTVSKLTKDERTNRQNVAINKLLGLTQNSAYSQAPYSLIRLRITCREKAISRKSAIGSLQPSLLPTQLRIKRILIFCSSLPPVCFLLILNVKDRMHIRVRPVTSQACHSPSRRVE
jgi:hypothetical protein